MLAELIGKGATVYVCGMCSQRAGIREADWIDGMKLGGVETIRVQMAPSTKTMSY